MRVIHTSDWHLGHMLRGEVARDDEHHAFVRWLLASCEREAPDVLLITGDVFDSATPSAAAERTWFDFLAAARRACPAMDIVAIAGNHDSPARLGAPAALLRELGVHVVGALPRREAIAGSKAGATVAPADGASLGLSSGGETLDLDRLLIPVAGGRGLIAAVPFLRPADLPLVPVERAWFDPETDRLESSTLEQVYAQVVAAARERRQPGQALIVTGHLYVAGADTAFLSERRVSIGGVEAAPLRMFPDDIDYVALGHIHKSQAVGRPTIRYAGAPIVLSLDEGRYTQQVLVIDIPCEGEAGTASVRELAIPRTVDVLRIPAYGTAGLDLVLAELAALPARDPTRIRPYLEVAVALDKPQPRLRALIEAAVDGKHARLVYLHVESTGDRSALADHDNPRRLAELDPRDVFVRLWMRDHAVPPAPDVLAAFDLLLAGVHGDLEDPG